MNLTEIITILNHLDIYQTDDSSYYFERLQKISKSEMIEHLSTIHLENATLIKENGTYILHVSNCSVRLKMNENFIDHIWVKKTFHQHRYRVDIAYDGSFYKGSQRQSQTKKTIQELVESVLNHLFQEKIQIHMASRTDKGVHAYQNVAHFDATRLVDSDSYLNLMNKMLPEDIQMTRFISTSPFFHARYDVLLKTYIYKFTFEKNIKHWHKKKYIQAIDLESLRQKASLFIGTHDFKNFSKYGDYTNTTRTIKNVEIIKSDDGFDIVITGKGFLRYMVRMMVGALIKFDYKTIQEALENLNSEVANHLFEASALYLKEIKY